MEVMITVSGTGGAVSVTTATPVADGKSATSNASFADGAAATKFCCSIN